MKGKNEHVEAPEFDTLFDAHIRKLQGYSPQVIVDAMFRIDLLKSSLEPGYEKYLKFGLITDEIDQGSLEDTLGSIVSGLHRSSCQLLEGEWACHIPCIVAQFLKFPVEESGSCEKGCVLKTKEGVRYFLILDEMFFEKNEVLIESADSLLMTDRSNGTCPVGGRHILLRSISGAEPPLLIILVKRAPDFNILPKLEKGSKYALCSMICNASANGPAKYVCFSLESEIWSLYEEDTKEDCGSFTNVYVCRKLLPTRVAPI